MKKFKILAIVTMFVFLAISFKALADYVETATDAVTITVTSPVTYTISVSTGTGCTSSGGGTVASGGTFSVTIGSSTGYNISSLTLDGVAAGSWGSSITFSNVTSNHSVSLGCTPINYLVSKSAGTGGSITLPNGLTNKLVAYNSTLSATITANSGYAISSVSGCSGSLSGTTYTTGAIKSACTISASFVSSPVNCVGSWSNTSTCSVTCGGGVLQQIYTITTPAANGGTACSYVTGDLRWGSTSWNTQACAVSCSSPCGTIACGRTCTAYLASSVTYPSSCTSQVRTCTNGTLSGTYTNSSCSVTTTTPTVTTTTPTSVSYTSAVSGGNVTSNGGSTVTVSGIVWHTSTPTVSTYTGKTTSGAASGSWTNTMTSLSPGTTYYVRAYATNSKGTSYGTTISFTTTATTTPTVSTTTPSSVTQTSANSGGGVSSNGGSTVTDAGIVWHVNTNPTTSLYTGKISHLSWADYSAWADSITGLSPSTTYYVRAYATNSLGTSYGNNLTFTTLAPANSNPTAPTISGNTSFYKDILQTFSITGTDPDSGNTIVYDIDWNNDGITDNTTSPYVSSGTTVVSPTYFWSTAGTYTFKARTKDNNGATSAWTSFSVTVSNPPAAASITSFNADKLSINYGQSVTLTWTSSNATSCSMSSSPSPSVDLSSLATTINNNIKFQPKKTTVYSLVCTGPGGPSAISQKTVTVGKIKPIIKEF